MKAIRLVPGQIVNPMYSSADKAAHAARGETYDIKPFLTLPKGEIVDSPDCWMLCIDRGSPLAPHDDECKKRVLAELSSADRLDMLQTLIRLNHPDVRKQQSKSQLEWLDMMVEIYSEEMDELQNPKPAKAAPAASPKPTTPVANV